MFQRRQKSKTVVSDDHQNAMETLFAMRDESERRSFSSEEAMVGRNGEEGLYENCHMLLCMRSVTHGCHVLSREGVTTRELPCE